MVIQTVDAVSRAGREDLRIVYSGLRPGEKLYEEKLMEEEGLKKTDNKQIYIGKPVPFDIGEFLWQLEELAAACYANDERIAELVGEIVPMFRPEGEEQDGDLMDDNKRVCNMHWGEWMGCPGRVSVCVKR